ncbi:unnamed protein product [Amoebophrya sp. A120]|nr:unnamed protein product [Amoebophrya sp. A120]|eukprot:GSA120T00003962001.1
MSQPRLPQIPAGQRPPERDFFAPRSAPVNAGAAVVAAQPNPKVSYANPLSSDISQQAGYFPSSPSTRVSNNTTLIRDRSRQSLGGQSQSSYQNASTASPTLVAAATGQGGGSASSSSLPPQHMLGEQQALGAPPSYLNYNTSSRHTELKILDDQTRLLKARQEDLERACLTSVKKCERDVEERSNQLKRQVEAVHTIVREDVQTKLKNLENETARSKRFVTKEVEALTEELVELKKNLLSADPWNNRTRFYQLEEQVRSLVAGRSKCKLPGGGDGPADDDQQHSPTAASPYSARASARKHKTIREERAETQKLHDMIDDAVAKVEISAIEKIKRLEEEQRRKEIEMMEKYEVVLNAVVNESNKAVANRKSKQLASEILNDAAIERSAGTGESLVAQNEINRQQFLKLQDEVLQLKAFAVNVKEEEKHDLHKLKQDFDEQLEVQEKLKKKELQELWSEKNALAKEVQTMAEKMQESLMFLANAAKNKEEVTKNQLMDQCYTMQTVHQNEFRVLLKKLDSVKNEEKTDKHSLLAEIEKVMSMCVSLSAYANDVNNRLQEARSDLSKLVDETDAKVVTRSRDHETRVKEWVNAKVADVDSRLKDLLSRYEQTCVAMGKLDGNVEKGNLAWKERFQNLERTTEQKCNAVEKHTEKKMQLLEFEVRSAVNTSMLDMEEKVSKNIQQQEKNNKSFRKLMTHELIDKTRVMFATGLQEAENNLMLKLEENRNRIDTVQIDLQQMLREKMLDLQERIYRLADEAAIALARSETELNRKLERAENDLLNKCDTLTEITSDLRQLIEDSVAKTLDEAKTLTYDVKDELEARILYEKKAMMEEVDRLLKQEQIDRMKQEAERLFGIQKRLTAFEEHVNTVLNKLSQDFELRLQQERDARQKNCGEIDQRAVDLSDRVNRIDNKHEDFQKKNEEKEYALGEGVLEVLRIREMDQDDWQKRLNLVLDHLRDSFDKMGVRVFEGDEKVSDFMSTKITKADEQLEQNIESVKTSIEASNKQLQSGIDGLEQEKQKMSGTIEVLKLEKNAINSSIQEKTPIPIQFVMQNMYKVHYLSCKKWMGIGVFLFSWISSLEELIEKYQLSVEKQEAQNSELEQKLEAQALAQTEKLEETNTQLTEQLTAEIEALKEALAAEKEEKQTVIDELKAELGTEKEQSERKVEELRAEFATELEKMRAELAAEITKEAEANREQIAAVGAAAAAAASATTPPAASPAGAEEEVEKEPTAEANEPEAPTEAAEKPDEDEE